MYALIAFLPLLVCVVAMAVLNWPAKYALPASWLLSCVFGFAFWKMKVVSLIAYSVSGLLNSFDVLVTVVGAIAVMNTLKMSGAMSAINNGFRAISGDSRVQALIIGWMFVCFLESAAGFGTPAALAGPLMVSLGFPPVCAAVFALICDSTAVSTGAIGTPIAQSIACLGSEVANAEFCRNFTIWTVVPQAVAGTIVPFMAVAVMCFFFGKERSVKPALQILPFAIFCGLAFSVPYIVFAFLFGYEFPSLFGSLIGLVISVVAAKKGFLIPKEVWHFAPESEWDDSWRATAEIPPVSTADMPLLRAWLPYVLITLMLVISRIPALGIKPILSGANESTAHIFAIRFSKLFGVENTSYTLKWAWLPGTIFIICALLTIPLHKMSRKAVKEAWKATFNQVAGAAIAVIFGLALVQILRFSGSNNINDDAMKSMIFYMAESLSKTGRGLYIVFAPIIGELGAFVSGSNTVSNTLFTNLQYQAALNLNLPEAMIVALQCIGGAIGNMICVNNTVAACATVGTAGKEGKIICINLIPLIGYTLIVIAVMALFML